MWREKRNDILGEKRREKYTLSTDFGILRVVVVKKWQPPKSTKPVDIIFCRIIFFLFFRSHSHQNDILVSSFFLFLSQKHTHKTDRQTTSSLKKKEKTCASSSSFFLSTHRKGDDDASWVTNEHEAEVSDMAREICSRAGSAKTDRRTRRRI